jgi:protein-L-isoaspartate(D-aspartate) O-methyltransferase
MFRAVRFALFLTTILHAQEPYAEQRDRMVREQIEKRGIHNADVLRTMRATLRHLFIPESSRALAYADRPVPLQKGQTISQPYIVALMTELLDVRRTHQVLEIGTGSGYQAAVLAPLVKELYTIELVPELATSAKATLQTLGYRNVTVRQGDGYQGWPEKSPFDRIIVTAAPPEIPEALLVQLKPGGKLVLPVGGTPMSQRLVVVDKAANGSISKRTVAPVMFVPMVKP